MEQRLDPGDRDGGGRSVSGGLDNPAFVPVEGESELQQMNLPTNNVNKPVKTRKISAFLPPLPPPNCTQDHDTVFENGYSDPSAPTKVRWSLEPCNAQQTDDKPLTRESLPHLDNYRKRADTVSRIPTLEELHEPTREDTTADNVLPEKVEDGQVEGTKFGWIEGVLIRNMLNIWGVMLFLRIAWVVGQAGIWQTLIIIALSTFITLLTAISVSAIATNGEIGGGGTYYVMSRSIGPEFGVSIGIIFAIANAINASLNVVGFCETLNNLLADCGTKLVDGGANDIRIIGTITMVAVSLLCGLGAKYESKTQVVLFVILIVALVNFVVGTGIGPKTDLDKAKGFLGYNLDTVTENWHPAYATSDGIAQNFFSVFSVFFPAVTGILAGANISGDLKDPSRAIPKGTIWAIIITSLTYALVAILCAATGAREATGKVEDLINGSWLECPIPGDCHYGLYNDYQIMILMSGFGPLTYAGCFAATISSALASYISCPKLLQVIAEDKLFPGLACCAKGFGKSKEPIYAYIFTFVLALVFVLIAELNQIALLISNFFLLTFALLNFCTFHVSLVRPIGWRPTFRYYNMWLSLLAALLCVVCMFLISWITAIITIVCAAALYLIVLYRKKNDVNWGSSGQAQAFKTALYAVQQLSYTEDHVKNYRPQILVLTGFPGSRPSLVDFAYSICKNHSLLLCGHVLQVQQTSRSRQLWIQKALVWLRHHKTKAFYYLVDNQTIQAGTVALLQTTGIGKMRPNVLLLGYKSDWRTCSKGHLDQYFGAIHDAFDMNVALTIFRVQGGLDFTGVIGDPEECGNQLPRSVSALSNTSIGSDSSTAPSSPGFTQLNVHISKEQLSSEVSNKSSAKAQKKEKRILRDPVGNPLRTDVVDNITRFRRKQAKGTIDVYWLYEDGGLTLLLPHIISNRSEWANSKLRIFCLATSHEEIEKEQKEMAALLAKFRIDVSDVIAIPHINKSPDNSTQQWFKQLISVFNANNPESALSEAELAAAATKSERHMRLREILFQHSSTANLIVMTLPMPRKGTISAPLYMAWLETLTQGMPPFLLVRGNQTSVLTFYS